METPPLTLLPVTLVTKVAMVPKQQRSTQDAGQRHALTGRRHTVSMFDVAATACVLRDTRERSSTPDEKAIELPVPDGTAPLDPPLPPPSSSINRTLPLDASPEKVKLTLPAALFVLSPAANPIWLRAELCRVESRAA